MKKIIYSKNAPAPIGPYSQAIMAGETLYASGQIALNPLTGELDLSSIESETERVMQNIKAVLTESQMDFENIVKCSIFLSNMDNFSRVNEIYGKYFPSLAPARETVEVSCLPKNVNVEISFIAIK